MQQPIPVPVAASSKHPGYTHYPEQIAQHVQLQGHRTVRDRLWLRRYNSCMPVDEWPFPDTESAEDTSARRTEHNIRISASWPSAKHGIREGPD